MLMWGEILGLLKSLTSFVKDVRSDREEREQFRRQLKALALGVDLLFEREEQRCHAEELRRKDEELRRKDDEQHRVDQAHEHEKLLLRLKIQLLEFERRLPSLGTPPPPLQLDQD